MKTTKPTQIPHIRPYRTNHKRLSRDAKWLAQWKYDTACAYFAQFNDDQLKLISKIMKTQEYLQIPQPVVSLLCADLLWIVKAIRKERAVKAKAGKEAA
jgi:hypothetical protein